MKSALPAPPAALVQAGEASMGRYAGFMPSFDWQGLAGLKTKGRLWQWTHHKRWQYVGIGSDALFIGLAIVNVGWCQTAFAYVFDRQRQKVVADWTADGVPGLNGEVSAEPVLNGRSWFRSFGRQLSIEQTGGLIHVRVKAGGIDLDAQLNLNGAAPFLLAVGPIDGGLAHATQKSSALAVRGQVTVGGQTWSLSDAIGCLDSSNGLLARETAWRWACAQGAEVGFNLQDGYFGDNENALWLGQQLIPLARAKFEFDPQQPMKPWRVSTADGLLDLEFTPEGARQQDRNLCFAASYYIQPVGTFSGWVKATASAEPIRVVKLVGVTEDHRSLW